MRRAVVYYFDLILCAALMSFLYDINNSIFDILSFEKILSV